MTTFLRTKTDGKAPTFINPKHIAMIFDRGRHACDVITTAGGDWNGGLDCAVRFDCSAEELIDQIGSDWKRVQL